MLRRATSTLLLLAALAFIATPPPAAAQRHVPPHAPQHAGPVVEPVESVPLETALDHPAIRNTREVWLEMLRRARQSIDIEQFYIANRPGEALEEVIRFVEAAAARGVRVRVIGEKKFAGVYPETLDRLSSAPGVEVRILDLSALGGGGVQHAKYFIVDGQEVFVGSQNWDWRALVHINELGLRVRDSLVADAFVRLFEYDWALAGGVSPAEAASAAGRLSADYPRVLDTDDGKLELTPVFSPKGLLPEGASWDAEALLALIDGARDSIKVQLLSYGTYALLEEALRRAAGRGVRVSLLVSDWSLSSSRQQALKLLQQTEGVTVRFTAIPEHSGGFISFARVEHCKFLLADADLAWIGTGNWSPDYFESSRNAGLILRAPGMCGLLHEKFMRSWDGPYAVTIDPAVEYENRRRDDGGGK